jgi:O-methyltransferase involved in polyketide biosynthesis
VDATRPQISRIYDYLLGGTNNHSADRRTGEAVLTEFPSLAATARANRAFLARAVRYAARQGIRQFLDVGAGLPTSPTTYDIARQVAPDSRVMYVDNDPMVLARSEALAPGDPRGRTTYIEADLRDPGAILADARLREVIDLDQPVALLLLAVLHCLDDTEHPERAVTALADALPRGSHVIASHATADLDPANEAVSAYYRSRGVPLHMRSRAEFAAVAFPRLRLVDPGIVLLADWRPDPDDPPAGAAAGWCGVAVKS